VYQNTQRMHSKYRILSAIARGVWAVEPTLVEGYLSFVDDLFAHKPEASIELNQKLSVKQAANDKADWPKLQSVTELERENYWRDKSQQFYSVHPVSGKRTIFFDDALEGSVAVIPVDDVIMREDFCGAMGLQTIEQVAVMAMAHKNIAGIVFYFHTPGGSIDYLKETANTIANSPKPTVAFISTMCASAGLYLASQCDYIIAENDIAIVGSIGVMMTLRDTRERDKKEGVRTIVIYGPQSTNKNKVYQDAIDGKTDPIINEQLAPLNIDFINAVKAGRGDKLDLSHPTLFTGSTFMSKDILASGLIDEINSFSYALQIAAGKTPKSATEKPVASSENSNSNSNMFNKFPTLSALIGKSAADLTAEDIAAVNAELKEKGVNATLMTEAALKEQITAETTPLNTKLTEAKNATATADAKILAAVKVFDPEATAETAASFDLTGKITALKNADAADEARLKAEKEKEDGTGAAAQVKAVEETSVNSLER
jgi:ClpP class serine protease